MKSYKEYDNLLEYGHDFLSQGSSNVYKYLEALSGDFWSCKKLLTYGRPFNFVTSERSVGKSTNIAMFLLLEWKYNRRKFIYCRRDKDTIQLTGPKFFDNAVKILNEKMPKLDPNYRQIVQMELSGGKYLFADEVEYKDEEDEEPTPVSVEIGYTIPLSLEAKSKSTPFGDVYNIVFDEFLERDPSKYLGNKQTMEYAEYEAIMSLYESVDRCIGRSYRNETRVFFLGNIKTKFCPLYLVMGMAEYVVSGAKFIAPKGKYWLMERVDGIEATKDKEQSFAFQMATEDHRKYAFSTDTAEDSTFIKKPGASEYLETVRIDGKDYGVRMSINEIIPEMFIGKPEQGRRIIALDNNSHNGIDYELISAWRTFPLTKRMADMYQKGLLFFDNEYTKQVFLKFLQFLDT